MRVRKDLVYPPTSNNLKKQTKLYKTMVFHTLTSGSKVQSTLRESKISQPYNCPSLLPGESFQTAEQERDLRGVPAVSLSWSNKVGSLKKPRRLEGRVPKRREIHRKREVQRSTEGLPEISAEYPLALEYKETTWGQGINHIKGTQRMIPQSSHKTRNNLCFHQPRVNKTALIPRDSGREFRRLLPP